MKTSSFTFEELIIDFSRIAYTWKGGQRKKTAGSKRNRRYARLKARRAILGVNGYQITDFPIKGPTALNFRL
jgi:hypothetical protein